MRLSLGLAMLLLRAVVLPSWHPLQMLLPGRLLSFKHSSSSSSPGLTRLSSCLNRRLMLVLCMTALLCLPRNGGLHCLQQRGLLLLMSHSQWPSTGRSSRPTLPAPRRTHMPLLHPRQLAMPPQQQLRLWGLGRPHRQQQSLPLHRGQQRPALKMRVTLQQPQRLALQHLRQHRMWTSCWPQTRCCQPLRSCRTTAASPSRRLE